MRLAALRLCNFRQHVDTHIEFDSGLTGIIGPNGAGKSTILEAIAWALYGMPAARGTRDSIRSLRAGSRAQVKVELEFELGRHRYHVVRGLTSAELFLDGAAEPVANSLTGVTDMLRRRLGMSLDEFFNTYFTGQKELSVMAAMGPSERGQFLSRVLGYDRLRTAQGLARDRRRLIVAETTGVRAGMPDAEAVARAVADAARRLADAESRSRIAETRRTETRARLDEVTPRWEAAQREREQLQALVAELRVVEGEATALHRDVARIESELAESAAARDELATIAGRLAPLANLRAQMAELDRLAREEGKRQTLVTTLREAEQDLTRLAERRAKIENAPQLEQEFARELDERRADLAKVDGQLEAARTEWARDKQEAETKIEHLKRQLQELRQQREQLVRLGEDGSCPTCTRKLGEHYRTVLDLLDEQIETVTVDGRYYRARIEQLETMPAGVAALDERRRELFDAVGKADRRLARVQSAIQELAGITRDVAAREERIARAREALEAIPPGYDQARHTVVRREIDALIPLEGRAARLGAAADRGPALATQREQARVAAERATTRAAELRTRRDAMAASEAAYGDSREAYESAAAAFREAEVAAVRTASECAGARDAVEVAARGQLELARAEEQLAVLTRDRRMHDELDRSYGDLRTELNQRLRPEIAERASRFLSELTDGRYAELELNESYEIVVLEEGVPKPVISGGEEDLANLVLRLAISEMIAERAGQPFSLLILDEIFGSLDEARRGSVVELLRHLHDVFEQVVLITHIDGVREGVDRIISVTYDDATGSARVEQEAAPLETLDDVHVDAAD